MDLCKKEYRSLSLQTKETGEIRHKTRIVTYVDLKKKKPQLISLLTNDMDMPSEEIIARYRKR